jgi:hypothetical protein
VVGDLGFPIVLGRVDLDDLILGHESDIAHSVLGVAEEDDEEVAGSGQFVAH